MEKVYHIYAKDRCLFHSIKEADFKATWSTLNNMVGVMKTDYSIDDLSYEELTINKESILNSSHWQSIYTPVKIDTEGLFLLWQKDLL